MATWHMYSSRLEANIQDVTRGVAFGFTSLISAPGFPPANYADLTPGSLHPLCRGCGLHPQRRWRWSWLPGGQVQLAGDLDAALYRAGDRAPVGVDHQRSLYLLAVLLFSCEVEGGRDPLDDEDLALGLYLPHRVCVEAVEGNLTRYQRAPKGSEQSPTCRGYQVVEGRGMRLFYVW